MEEGRKLRRQERINKWSNEWIQNEMKERRKWNEIKSNENEKEKMKHTINNNNNACSIKIKISAFFLI